MDAWTALQALILGIVEGLTEFLPISSTGHLILASPLLDFRGENVARFEIAIQTGAMFVVIWEYRQKLAGTLAGIPARAHGAALRRQRDRGVHSGRGLRPDPRLVH